MLHPDTESKLQEVYKLLSQAQSVLCSIEVKDRYTFNGKFQELASQDRTFGLMVSPLTMVNDVKRILEKSFEEVFESDIVL